MSVTPLVRPAVSNPRPQVSIDGQQVEAVDELLLAMEMREQEGGLAGLELRLSNVASFTDGDADFAFEDERVVRLGSRITVAAGDASQPQEIFRGVITALEAEFPGEGPPELLLLAEDALQPARMARRSKVYRDMGLAEVVQSVAQTLGLQAEVTSLDDPRGTWVQLNESDLAFLRRLLHGVDADLQIVADRLQVAPVSEVQREALELAMFDDLRSVRFIADLAHQVTAVTSAGWNPHSGETVSGRGEGRNLGPGRGRRGADLLREALGERVEHVGQIAVTSNEEAQALADTVFDRRARSFVTAEGTATGHPRIRVGCHLSLTGVSPRFANTYYVTSTHHRYNVREGYMTDFRAESAALREVS